MKQCFRWAQAMLFAGLCGGATWAACPSYATAERFQISADGTEVTDLQTGLTWARCSEGNHGRVEHARATPASYPMKTP